MDNKSLLHFSAPEVTRRRRQRGRSGLSKLQFPSAQRQSDRLGPVFKRLVDTLDARNIWLRNNVAGVLPDQILVLETVGTVNDFLKAVKKIDGLEWLADIELFDIPPDDDFYEAPDNGSPTGKLLTGALFLVTTNVGALNTLRLRFDDFQRNPNASFRRGLAPLKRLFEQLREVRLWGAEDRMGEFRLFDDWKFRLEHSSESDLLPFEAELWFRDTDARRNQAYSRFSQTVISLGGQISRSSVIPEISYHGVVGQIPVSRVRDLVDQRDSRLVMCEDVMFLRPVGQFAVLPTDDQSYAEDVDFPSGGVVDLGNPVAALFDGFPLTGHKMLAGFLDLDDPDGYEGYYQARQRHHGTAMASLICHGELDSGDQPMSRRLYVRPIMRPGAERPDGSVSERIPDGELPVDLVHRAVRRLFDEDGEEPPVAPGVRVINLSVCDNRRPFMREMSPLARLLDWLAVKYQVLFIVSAGNHLHSIELPVSHDEFHQNGLADLQAMMFNALADDTRNRSLLSPAETVNGLTVGATHSDVSAVPDAHRLLNPYDGPGFPSVVSAHGPGYYGSIKPDLLLPGGRSSLRESIGSSSGNLVLEVVDSSRAPGQKVACPGEQGSLDATRYTRGTSNATALATRAACRIYDVLNDLREQFESFPGQEFDAVLLKTLLVHGAHCELPLEHYSSIVNDTNYAGLKKAQATLQKKARATRLIGYGVADLSRVMLCTDQRVTVLGCGKIGSDEAHVFRFPVPQELSGVAGKRRVITTMAWLSPINCSHRNYRKARLDVKLRQSLAGKPVGNAYHKFSRGTVYHDVREGYGAQIIEEGTIAEIHVECHSAAGTLDEQVRYGLAVTLELTESVDVRLYEAIRNRLILQDQVPIQL